MQGLDSMTNLKKGQLLTEQQDTAGQSERQAFSEDTKTTAADSASWNSLALPLGVLLTRLDPGLQLVD